MSGFQERWAKWKPVLLGVVVGLLAGPLISGVMGWQVTQGFMDQSVHNAVVKKQAEFCSTYAHEAVKDPAKLDFDARYDLAQKWAKMPGEKVADPDVVSACVDELAG